MSITVTISGSPVVVMEGTLQIKSRVDDKDSAQFTVRDDSGTAAYVKGQPVRITDSAQGLLFSGFINKPTMSNLFPNPTNLWSMDCVNKFVVTAKKATKHTTSTGKRHRGGKHANQHAGAIAALQIKEYVEPEAVTGSFGLDWTELQTSWQAGTLTNTVSATNTSTGNPGAGDLELAPTGTPVAFQQQTQADFTTGGIFGGTASPASGGLTFAPSSAMMFQATQSIAGLSNASVYVKVWSGSYILQSGDAIGYDIWIADSSPQCKMSLEVVFTDGTSLVNTITNTFDALGFSANPNTDLSGVAKNVWYGRAFIMGFGGYIGKTVSYVALACAGQNQGNYTAYYRNIAIKNGSTTQVQIFSNTAIALPMTPQTLQNNGYNPASVTFVTAYERHGYYETPSYSLANAGIVQSSYIDWTITQPNNNFTLLITASIDGGATFIPCAAGGAIAGLLPGMNLTGKSVRFFYILDAGNNNDPTQTPILNQIKGGVFSAYPCTKSDLFNITNTTALWNAGTLTNLVAASNHIALNGYARNWQNADMSNLTLFGSASPAQGTNQQQFYLSSATGGDARSRFDFAGSAWQNFTAEVDIVLPPANTQAGFEYRTTGYQNTLNTFGYVVMLSTTQIQFGYGTNTSSGAGSFTSVQTVSVTLSAGTTYRLKIIVNGSSHSAYINDVLMYSVTNATYSAAGNIGLRFYNSSGSNQTCQFDNFGVMLSLSGQWVSPAIDIHSLGSISNSALNLEIDPATNMAYTSVLAEISLNNGASWTALTNIATTPGYYQALTLPGLTPGTNVSSITQLKIRLTISTNTAAAPGTIGSNYLASVPDLTACTLVLIGAYSSSGSRHNAPLIWDSVNRVPIASGWGNASDGEAYTQVGTATTSVAGGEAIITNTTGDVYMIPAAPTAGDQDGSYRFELSASTMNAGILLRYVDSNNFFRCSVNTTTITLLQKALGTNNTLQTASVALSTGVFYHMRFQVIGSGPVTLNGKVWPDGQAEPFNWTITTTI